MEFTRDNYKQYFAKDNFTSLNPFDREKLIRFSVDTIRKDLGLGEVNLQFVNNGEMFCGQMWVKECRGAIGSTVTDGNMSHRMFLNSDSLIRNDDAISYETFKTINHELEHGVQNTQIRNKAITNDNTEVCELRGNSTYYYKPSGSFVDENGKNVGGALYLSQVKEAKAREAGLNAVKKLVEENKANGINDPAGEDYVYDLTARENTIRKNNIQKLGAHSREEMAKEALDNMKSVTNSQRKAVIDQARKADYENLKMAYGNGHSDKELKSMFENDTVARNYYQTPQYRTTMKYARLNQAYDASDVEKEGFISQFDSNNPTSAEANTEYIEKFNSNDANTKAQSNEEFINKFSEANTSQNNTQASTSENTQASSNSSSQSNSNPM